MNKNILVWGALGIGAFAVLAKAPVVMTVNGEDVPLSEFEYLYNKNSEQQLNPQPLNEYVDMFQIYKLKVADARAEGIDTTAAFRKEMMQYKHDLALPYLTDSLYIYQLLDEAYDRTGEEVEVSHIMFFKGKDESENEILRLRADSLYQTLKNGGNFEATAREFSQDKASAANGGHMGYIQAGSYPYHFESAAYGLKNGELYPGVVESPFGYHIVKGGAHRKSRGKVLVGHILKMMPAGADPEQEAAVKQAADSLYAVVMADPDNFKSVATKNSDDRNSARIGGMLPWFGAGEMIQEFDSVSFALPEGEISRPLKSRFGYHIIKKFGHRDNPPKEEFKTQFIQRISTPNDERYNLVRKHQTDRLAKRHKGVINKATLAKLHEAMEKNGLDSALVADWTQLPQGNQEIFSIKGKSYPVKGLMEKLTKVRHANPTVAKRQFDKHMQTYFNKCLVEVEEDALLVEKPEYRNLYNEYVDGSLLYEVSVKKVWDRAAQDTEGLEKYFAEHRGDYSWTTPQAKGYLVQTVNDSVADLIRKRAAEVGRDSLVNTLRKEFPRELHIERVLVGQGVNGMVDYLMFGGPKVESPSATFPVYFMIDSRIITEPEDVADVRGQVTSDYQNEFERRWVEELKSKYPVTVNKKILKKVKSNK